MTEKEVRKLIGNKNWKKFMVWMRGQTVSCDENGEIDYYDWDVQAFVVKLKTGFDRQNSIRWD